MRIRMDLAGMTPRGELTSTGYCLAKPGAEYLVYAPLEVPRLESLRFVRRLTVPIRNIRRLFDTTISLDLSSHPSEFRVEWLKPYNGEVIKGEAVKGGAKVTLTAPFKGDAVLISSKRIVRPRICSKGSFELTNANVRLNTAILVEESREAIHYRPQPLER